MTGLRPGDVITDEPTTPAPDPARTEVIAELERQADHLGARSADIGTGIAADTYRAAARGLRRRAAELRQATPPTADEPAEEWETVTAGQVSVGDHIEITRKWPEGRFVASGVATRIYCGMVEFGDRHAYTLDDTSGLHTSSTIRRLVRKPMPEPEAPAVIRHAGRTLARPDWSQTGHAGAPDGSPCWVLMSGKPPEGRTDWHVWLAWPQVLALDPDTDPDVVDLGGDPA